MKLIASLLFLSLMSLNTFADKIIESSQKQSTHTHSAEEIGIALAPVYNTHEEEYAFGLHLHYTYRVFPNPKFAIGAGYEHIFDDHKHQFAGFIVSYTPIQHLVLSLTPGIAFHKDEVMEKHFGMHVEVLYEIAIKQYHIGPVFEMAYEPHGSHIALGLHLGFGF